MLSRASSLTPGSLLRINKLYHIIYNIKLDNVNTENTLTILVDLYLVKKT